MNKHNQHSTSNPTANTLHTPVSAVAKTNRVQAQPAGGNGDGNDLDELAALISQEQIPLLSQWREQVRELPNAKDLDAPTLDDHIPDLLAELIAELKSKSNQTIPAALNVGSAPAHGRVRLKDGFDIEEVLAEYNVLRGCIHDLADNNGLTLQGLPFHTLNRVFDQAIGQALQAYTAQRTLEDQSRREEYLAFVAHDIQNPLHAISLVGNVLEKKLTAQGGNDVITEMLKTLRRNVQDVESLVVKVLEENASVQTEGGTKLQRRNFELWPVVEGIIQDFQPLAGTGNTKLLNKVPYNLTVYADSGLLKRIFQNLIANAIKYTPGGGILIEARVNDDQGFVECRVSDNGAGISPNRIEQIFDKGETDESSEEGMGLGLAIVKTFVEAHDGNVSVESKEGVGSTFLFTLPQIRM